MLNEMAMKIKLSILLLMVLPTPALLAQGDATAVIHKYYQAIGGQEKIKLLTSIYSLAACNGPNGPYQTEMLSLNGSKTQFRQMREHKPDYTGITNGDTYWTSGTTVALADKNAAFAWRSHEAQWMATHLEERFQQLTLSGNTDFGGKKAIKLSGMDELNKTVELYFDKKINLLLGIILFSPFSKEPETIRMEIDSWQKTDDVLFPSKISFTDKQGKFELSFHTIKVNQVDTSIFVIPEKIVALKELLALHELQRTAHFNRDAKLLVSILADDYSEISRGKISSPKKEDLIKRFQNYFDSVTFLVWDDLQTPVIKLSDDNSMAFVSVHKKVKLKTSKQAEEETTYAWTAVFQKIGTEWKMSSMTSTQLNQE